jgi:2-C-methyl-D-erythritol 4-phosphate cytidylyltransferase
VTTRTALGDVAILVPAAGMGVRLGPGQPKALRTLAGQSLLVRAVGNLLAAPSTGLVVVAAPPADVDLVREMLPATPQVQVVAGGATRQESVARALAAVPAEFDLVLVHDAARCLAPPSMVEDVAAALRAGASAVIPVLPVADTIKRVDADDAVVETVDRSVLRAVQTPQGFRRDVLAAAHAGTAAQHTDDAGMVEAMGVRVTAVPGHDYALKITRPFDLVVAEALLAEMAGRAEPGSISGRSALG